MGHFKGTVKFTYLKIAAKVQQISDIRKFVKNILLFLAKLFFPRNFPSHFLAGFAKKQYLCSRIPKNHRYAQIVYPFDGLSRLFSHTSADYRVPCATE